MISSSARSRAESARSRQPVGDPHLDIESVPDPEHVLWIDPAHPA
jgi:hypothetical protein